MNPEDLWAEEKAQIPEDYHDAFDQLVGNGCSPSGVTAAVEYVRTDKTQKECSSEFGVSEVTIRKLYPSVLALAPQEDTTPSSRWVGMRSEEFADAVARALDWEEGVEYAVQEPSHGNKPGQPRLYKAGWRDLYRRFIDGDEDGGSE